MLKRLIQFAIVCTVVAFIASCTSPIYKFQDGAYKPYKGDPSPPDKIATLHINGLHGLYVCSIDGHLPPQSGYKPVGSRDSYEGGGLGSTRIELLPGEHTISVGFKTYESYSSVGQQTITFNVETGKVYTVVQYMDTVNMTWKASVEEIISKTQKGVIPQLTQPDRATEIYFIRKWEFFGCGVKYKLIFDGVDFFHLGAGKYTMIKADPGKHLAGVPAVYGEYSHVSNKGQKEFDFQPNQKYYLDVTTGNVDGIDIQSIRLLSTSDGEALMKKCTYDPYVPH